MKKFILMSGSVFAILGVALTVFVIVGASWDIGVEPDSKTSAFLVEFAFVIIAAPVAVCQLLALPQNASWLLIPLGILTNAVLCFLVGAYFGFLARLVTKTIRKTNDAAA